MNAAVPSANFSALKPELQTLHRLVRTCSLQCLQATSHNNALVMSEGVDADRPAFGHLMTVMILASTSLRLTFKVHFGQKAVHALMQKSQDGDDARLTAIASDYMRELCNLSCGQVKTALMAQGIDAGLTLPVVTRGFVEVMRQQHEDANSTWDAWYLGDGKNRIVCTASLSLLNESALGQLALLTPIAGGDAEIDLF